jgi:serine/threonine-protein kinase
MAPRNACPGAPRWREFLEGSLARPIAAILSRHLDGCTRCQQLLEQLTAGTDPWLDAARQGGPRAAPEPPLRRVMKELEDEVEVVEPAAEPNLDFLTPPAPGSGYMGRLGEYDVAAVIGRGGMGVVLKAFEPALNRYVAIKVLWPGWTSSGAARARFAREAKATAAVRHDNVVAIYGVDEVKSLPYLVMEYIHGPSLQERLDRRGPLEVKEILRIGMQVAAGLAAAHAQGLVHRDVKPSNILLENDVEHVKLSDFGLARAIDDASLTQSGVIAGTPQYMAPEQARGEQVDHRADLFSLGSVLYAMSTGRPPFRAANTVAVLKRVCEDEPRPPHEVNPDLPPWLGAIIARLHAKHPDDRFQSAAEASQVLAQYLAHLQQPARVPRPALVARAAPARPPVRRRRVGLGLAVVALALVLGPCLGLGLLSMSYSMLGGASAPPLPPTAVRVVDPQPRAILANGKFQRDDDGVLCFSVDYNLRPGPADNSLRYVWVVRCGEQTLYEKELRPDELDNDGTLQGDRQAPEEGVEGEVQTYLECKRVVPGLGEQRERISNAMTLVVKQGK